MTTAMATPSMARMKKRMNGFMRMPPGIVDAFKFVAVKLPVASFLFNFARGFNTRLRIRLNPTVAAGRFLPPPPVPNSRFHFLLDLDARLW
jgi:hypothetical protein